MQKNDATVIQALSEIETYLATERREKGLPGCSVAIVYDQQILWSKGFGYADLEAEIPARPETIYCVSSITKLFTATMLMQVRDAGAFHLDEPLEKYLPDFSIRSRFRDPRPLTFRQVVSHTSGLPREAPLDYMQSRQFPITDTILRSLHDTELNFAPLTTWKYSNLGYAILGHALATIVGIPYTQYIEERIFRSLGMKSSSFDCSHERIAQGYLLASQGSPQRAERLDFRALTPAMGAYTSVVDIARFIMLQFSEEAVGGSQILGATTLREMHAPVFMKPDWCSGIGLGWRLERLAEQIVLHHSGGIYGFSGNIMLIPAQKLGVAIFTNGFFIDNDWRSTAMSRRILERLLPVIAQLRARQTDVSAYADESWRRYTGRYSMQGLIDVDLVFVDGRLSIVRPEQDGSISAILMPEGEEHFRMHGGPLNGELVVFETDEHGNVTRLKTGGLVFVRLDTRT